MKRLVVFLALALSFSQAWSANNALTWRLFTPEVRTGHLSGFIVLYSENVNDFLGADASKVFWNWVSSPERDGLNAEILRRYSIPGNESYPMLKMFREVLEDSLSTVPGGAEVVRKMREVRNKLRAAWGGEPL